MDPVICLVSPRVHRTQSSLLHGCPQIGTWACGGVALTRLHALPVVWCPRPTQGDGPGLPAMHCDVSNAAGSCQVAKL